MLARRRGTIDDPSATALRDGQVLRDVGERGVGIRLAVRAGDEARLDREVRLATTPTTRMLPSLLVMVIGELSQDERALSSRVVVADS